MKTPVHPSIARAPVPLPTAPSRAPAIIKALEHCAQRTRPYRVFDDWVDCVTATLAALPQHALALLSSNGKKMADDTEETKALWARLIDRYGRDGMQHFKDAFHELLASTEYLGRTAWGDTIGDVYMQFSNSQGHLGQYFTPWDVAKMMAEMQSDHGVEIERRLAAPEPFEPVRVLDPACGSGVLLLALASTFPEDYLHRQYVRFYGQDLDSTCVKMCRINMTLYGLNGTALWLPTKAK